MSQAPQSPPVFVDIHMNNGRRVGFRTFSDILHGRFHGDMQLAFEQYLGDFQAYGAAHRTYRYSIGNGYMFLLHAVLNPLTPGPALAAPVTQPGPQYPNAQTRGSAYQESYTFQPYQPMANFSGFVNPSTVPTMRYAPANATWMSISQPRQLDPIASEFKVSSTVKNLGASARPSALPAAKSAPAYLPSLPVTQQPQFTPSNGHRGFLAPDQNWQLSRSNGETARAGAAPSNSDTPYSSPIHRQGQAVSHRYPLTPSEVFLGYYNPDPLPSNTPIRLTHSPIDSQQPRLAPSNPRRGNLTLNTRLGPSYNDYGEAVEAPASPPALTHSHSTASQESWLASPSPLDLGPGYSFHNDNPHLSPRVWSRDASEHSSDLSSHSGSMQGPSTSHWANPHHTIHWSSHSIANGSSPKVNNTDGTSHSPQHGEADIGVAPFPPAPTVQLQPRDGFTAIMESRHQEDLHIWIKNWREMHPSKPLNRLLIGLSAIFYASKYREWLKTAPPGSDIFDFSNLLDSAEHSYIEELDRLGIYSKGAVPFQRFDQRSATFTYRAGPSTIGNGINTSHEVARSDPSTWDWLADGVSRRTNVSLQTPPRPQLQNGNNRSESDRNSHFHTQSDVDARLEAQFLTGLQQEDPRIMQRLSHNRHDFFKAYDEILMMQREAKEASR